jgi:hypothetical protein
MLRNNVTYYQCRMLLFSLIDVLTASETLAICFMFMGDPASHIHATMALWGDLALWALI